MFYVYILFSEKWNRYYVGMTSNLKSRLKKHNSGGVKSTRYGKPWSIVVYKKYQFKGDAMRIENEIKKKKNTKRVIESWKE